MIIRLLFPYILLMLIVFGYMYIRRLQLGAVLFKVNRILISRYNADSLVLILIITAASYFLSRFDMQNAVLAETALLGSYAYVYFYAALVLVVVVREVERPALREKGISTPRGFWKWEEVASYRWSKQTLSLSINRNNRKRSENWQFDKVDKKELDAILKAKIPKQNKRLKKKI